MRAFLSFIAIAVTATFASVAPAAAKWNCAGPQYVCGSSKSAAQSSHHKKSATKKSSYYKKAAYKASKTHYRSRNVAAKHGKTHRVATYAPAKSYKKKSYSKSASVSGSYSGQASYYWQPQRVASGGWFNPNALTAAHKTLPFGTKVRVTNRNNGRSVVVTINDRGPYVRGRIIDLSKAAAHRINMQGSGVVPVTVAVLGRG